MLFARPPLLSAGRVKKNSFFFPSSILGLCPKLAVESTVLFATILARFRAVRAGLAVNDAVSGGSSHLGASQPGGWKQSGRSPGRKRALRQRASALVLHFGLLFLSISVSLGLRCQEMNERFEYPLAAETWPGRLFRSYKKAKHVIPLQP